MTTALGPHFAIETPSAESLAAEFDALDAKLAAAPGEPALIAAVEDWDAFRRRLHTWGSLVNLRFRQDTRDPEAVSARELLDKLNPRILARNTAVKRRLLTHPLRIALEARFGLQAFRLWEADAETYAPQIEADLVREAELEAAYESLLGGIMVDFDGRRMTFGEIRGYANAQDRGVRYAAERVRWEALAAHGAELDRIYDELVRLRDRMGKALHHQDFIPLAYARMKRVDYDAQDVARWRDAVVRDVVPLASEIIAKCATARGYEQGMAWDEAALSDADIRPVLDGAGLVRDLPAVLGEISPRLGAFGAFMRDHDYLDVFAREGKGPGGFCTMFPTEGHPYIFASFNGTKDDVKVLVHEMGHAFQGYSSNALPLDDYLVPTFESAEIHSMSLEYLSWPGLEKYFGANTETFCVEHLAGALLFLPYGCAVDHFQHLVYARPEATPGERRAMWLEIQARYLPWRDYGDIPYPAAGNAWQQQLHVYARPFYYIDYTLAQCCALQFWAQAQGDQSDAVARYIALCERGGSASFGELVASAGLSSPFDGEALGTVVAAARDYLTAAGLL